MAQMPARIARPGGPTAGAAGVVSEDTAPSGARKRLRGFAGSLRDFSIRHPRQGGACWLFLELWRRSCPGSVSGKSVARQSLRAMLGETYILATEVDA